MIQAVKASNFLSWKELHFEVNKGVTLIDGFNRDDNTPEGSGKSAVLNAICWGFYGKIPKDANVDEVIKEGEKSGGVQIECGDFTVVRNRKPNELYYKDFNGKIIKGKDARETQKLIEELIGMSFDAFCQTVYFPQNYPKKFITASQEDKGKILSEVQDLQIFDKARKEVLSLQKSTQDKINSLQMDFREISLKIEHCESEINYIKQQDAQQTITRNEQLQNLKSQIFRYDADIKEEAVKMTAVLESIPQAVEQHDLNNVNAGLQKYDTVLAGLKYDIDNIDAHNKKLFDLQNQSNFYQRQATSIVSKIDKLQNFVNNPSQKCPTCGSELEEADTSHAENEINELSSQLDENGVFLNDFKSQIENFQNKDKQQLSSEMSQISMERANLLKAKNQLESIGHTISNKENQIKMIEQNILKLNSYIETVQTQITTLENTALIDYEAQIGKKKEELISYKEQEIALEGLLKDNQTYFNRLTDLKNGFKEVKSYTFNSVLAELAIKANKYLQELFEVPMSIKFTNENMKIGTEVTMAGKSRSLGLLSGGQFRRTCLAVDLALSEIVALRTGSKMNIRILDEYFKDLSESSMEKCLRLLEKLGGSTILIEHNSIFKSIVDTVFECELIDGTTRSVV